MVGTARSNGNSSQVAKYLQDLLIFPLIDLNNYTIYPFNYNHDYPEDDDFQFIISSVLRADVIILVTPVYWYTVSTSMKIFMDRLTDLITIHKKQGRLLKGKYLFSMSCGAADDMPDYFHEPFRLTAAYLDLHYGGFVHTWIDNSSIISESVKNRIESFYENIISYHPIITS
ncbi:MAG: flavodoxin family protein [Saprospiraceae bacterium]